MRKRSSREGTPRITPQEFVAKWRQSSLKEASASQEHFIDLCRLIGHPTPAEADPEGTWFCFERGASKVSGGEGWADVWKKGFFAWEYKGKKKDLEAAYRQLLQYRTALLNPPLLIVSDMETILIRTDFTNTVRREFRLSLDDLLEPAGLETLRAAFENPDRLRAEETSEAGHAGGRHSVLQARRRAAVAWSRPARGRALPDSSPLLSLRRGRRPPAKPALPPARRERAERPGFLRGPGRPALRRHADGRVVWDRPDPERQRRPVRRVPRPPSREAGPRDPRPSDAARLVGDRALDLRDPVRAEPRPREARPARRPLHEPRGHLAHRRARAHGPASPTLAGGEGEGARSLREARLREERAGPHAPPQRPLEPSHRLRRRDRPDDRARSRVRERQLPLRRPARAARASRRRSSPSPPTSASEASSLRSPPASSSESRSTSTPTSSPRPRSGSATSSGCARTGSGIPRSRSSGAWTTSTRWTRSSPSTSAGNPVEPEWPEATVVVGNPPFLGGSGSAANWVTPTSSTCSRSTKAESPARATSAATGSRGRGR